MNLSPPVQDSVTRRVELPLIVAGAVGLFGGLVLGQAVILLLGVASFVSGLVVRAVRTNKVIKALPPVESARVRQANNSGATWMYVAVLIGFVSFMIRFVTSGR